MTTVLKYSEFDTLEIIRTGRVTIEKAANDNHTVETYTHNLGYVPIVIAFAEYDFGSETLQYPLPWDFFELSGANAGLLQRTIYFDVNEAEVDFNLDAPTNGSSYGGEETVNVVFYLLRHRAKG